ncbi:dihydroorotase [Endobacter medicaginis]|uniref:Dihydroorotase n=1 Tax=Endobacter medicaginis TaxID=1181271 RepID=A0A850NR01_9PROT|nr:dihydroorotase [Endobacter medicaginis]MBB3172947.1 dihydroorotase [Endobacter medicaginis]MCX5476232.1 dihydroorotase [Endobacter medicaginis]NVN29665.1 dihydroorotase [Endobacter medicaginis]
MSHYDLIIAGGTVVLPWGIVQTDLGIVDGRIASLSVGAADAAHERFDARHLHVLPGLIDPHVHLRDPGDASVESIPTGTRAALLGGITTVFDMPNTKPAITDAATLDWKRDYAPRESHTDFGIYVGATRANTPDLAEYEQGRGVCAIKLFAGSSTGDLMIEDDAGIEAVMRAGARRIAFHSEDEYRLQERRKLFSVGDAFDNHRIWRDEECAFLGTRRIMALARKTGRPAHILHVSTAEELDYLKDFRDIATCEVLVNHLTQIAPECYETLGALAVMNPPIRDRRHYEASWAAINDGTVDTIGSDHAPHPLSAKAKPWPETPAGLTGVQTLVPVMLDHVNAGRTSLGRMVDLMAAGPARVYGLQGKGRIAAGYDADFTIVDLGARRRITNDWIVTPAGWTPFDGMEVAGWPVAAVLRGRVAMCDDMIVGPPCGRLARFAGERIGD